MPPVLTPGRRAGRRVCSGGKNDGRGGQEKEKKLSQADMKNRNRYEEREKMSQADMKNKKPI